MQNAAERAQVGLYRVQQRLAITRSEAIAVLLLVVLLGTGMALRYAQGRPQAAPGTAFAATDHRFQQAADRLRAASAGAAPSESGEASAAAAAGPPPPSEAAPVNVNSASAPRLQQLPGVGPVLAGRIVAYREAHGSFAEVGHLERVSGIGPKTMARLAPMLTVSAPEQATGEQAAAKTPDAATASTP